MAMIKDAFTTLPAKPALYIAPILVVLVLSLYYRDQYNQCTGIKRERAALNDYLRSLDGSTPFRMVDFTAFEWNKVRIVAPVKPGTIADECPFDWNWASGERDALLADGLLTSIVFGLKGQVVSYLELRGDEVEILGAEGNLQPQAAVFDVKRKSGDAAGVTLTLVK